MLPVQLSIALPEKMEQLSQLPISHGGLHQLVQPADGPTIGRAPAEQRLEQTVA